MVEKGRQRKSRLDIAKVREMRAGGMTQQEIANAFSVSRPLISMVLSGKIS
jgi:predicted XRE-type DNA-binding protein